MQATKSRRASEPPHRISNGGSHQPKRISTYRIQKENEQNSFSRNSVVEKGSPSQFTHMESQLKEVQEELKRARDQLASSETCRKTAQLEAADAKKQLFMVSLKFEDSQRQLIELSAAEDYRIMELRKISQERDKAWQSEVAALQNQQSVDMAAWSSVTKEVQRLKSQIELLKEKLMEKDSVIESFEIQTDKSKGTDESSQTEPELKEAMAELADLKSKLVNKDTYLESIVDLNKKLNDEIRAQVSQVEADFSSKFSQAAVDTSGSSIEFSQTESELESELREAKTEITELKAKLVHNDVDLRTILDMNKKLNDEIRAKVKEEEAEFSSKITQATVGVSELTFESSQTETELREAKALIADLKLKLVNKDADLRSILDMNKKLNNEIRAQVNQVEAEFNSKIAQAAIDISELKVKLTDKDAVFKPIEAELRRVKAHSNQWRKAAETAAAILMTGKNGREMERSGSVDAEYLSDGKFLNSPNWDETGGESPSKNHNVVRMIAGLWKKS